jgi:hypothetical protein
MASVVNNALKQQPENNNSSNSNGYNTNEKNDKKNVLPPPTILIPETGEEKRLRKIKERNLLRSQIYYGELGKLTAAEEAQKRAKEKLAQASESAKTFLKVFKKKDDTKLSFAIIGVAHQQDGGFYSAKEIPGVKYCPNQSKGNDIHKCTEYCKRRYGLNLNETKACSVQ